MDSFKRIDTKSLPPIEEVYSLLTDESTTPEDYQHAKNVF